MGIFADRGYTLEQAKTSCLGEIESWYGGKVLDVFDSSASGIARRYYCSEADQLRMVNGRISNTSMNLMCGAIPADPEADPVYDWLLHTSTECGKAHTDYVQFTKDHALRRQQLFTMVAAATTVLGIDDIMAQLV